MRRAIIGSAAILLLAGAAWGDEVQLRSGQKITGMAREEGEKIVVELALGTVAFDKKDVVSITPGRTLIHDYKDKAEAIRGSKEAKDWLELGKWARDNGLTRYVKPNLEKALDLDPNNESARRALGYTLYKGKWMTEEEVRREQGYIWYEGRWMTILERELIIRKRLDAEASVLAAAEEKRRKKEAQKQARLTAIQDYYDRLAEEARLRRMGGARPRAWRGTGYGPRQYWGGYGEAVPTFDVVGYLNSVGWSFVPVGPVRPFSPFP